MVALTGVSGSGKSTLLQHILLPALERGIGVRDKVVIEGASVAGIEQVDKVISIDQDPIGRTVRSDVATYCDVLTPIREFSPPFPKHVRGVYNPNTSAITIAKGCAPHAGGWATAR